MATTKNKNKKHKNGKRLPPALQTRKDCLLTEEDLEGFEKFENQLRFEEIKFLEKISIKCLSLPGPRGYTLLHLAIMNTRPETVKMLLEKGVSPDTLDSHGNSALTLSIGEKEIFYILAGCKKINFEIANSKGRRPLHDACTYAEVEIVTILLEKEVDVNAEDMNKETPLIYAMKTLLGSAESKARIVELLLKKGASCDIKSHKGETLMDIAIEGKSLDILKILNRYGMDPTGLGIYGLTPLKKATMMGSFQIVEFFVRLNINVNVFDKDMGKSSFRTATENGFLEISELLVKAGTQLPKEYWLWRDQFMSKSFFVCEQNKKTETISWLKCLVSKPLSLKSQTRITLRRTYPNQKISSLFDKVSYPKNLKDYVLLQ